MNTAICFNCGSACELADGTYLCHVCGFSLPQTASPKIQKRLSAAFALLHKSQFGKARTAFEAIILKDIKNASAYWGRLCARYHIFYIKNENGKPVPDCPTRSGANLAEDVDYRKAMLYADEEMKAFLQSQAEHLKVLCSGGDASKNATRQFTMDEVDPNDELMGKWKKSKYTLTFEANTDGTYQVSGIKIRQSSIVVIPYKYQGKAVTKIGEKAFCDGFGLWDALIPDSVTSIGEQAFEHCYHLTSVTIPDSVTSIDSGAFEGCVSLKSITIPNGVNSIAPRTFYGCSSLTSVTVPNSVTSIGANAFEGCGNLKNVTIPNGVNSIALRTFYGCSSLTSVTIPESVTSINYSAFQGCSSLTSIIVPNSVTKIHSSAFQDCNSLRSISLPFIGHKPFDIYNPDYDTHLGYIFGASSYFYNNDKTPKSLKTVQITGDSPLSPGAFHCCHNLTKIDIRGNVKSIENSAFFACSGLTNIVIPDSVTKIGGGAFAACNGLTSIVIPDGVTELGDETFKDCINLTSVTIPYSVTKVGKYLFKGCSSLRNVRISERAPSTCENSISMSNVVLPCDVTKNTLKAFFYAYSKLTSIDFSMFEDCVSLINFVVPDGVKEIGSNAFLGCSNLERIVIPKSVREIRACAFEGCKNLKSIIYDGTKAQWKTVSLGSSWNYGAGSYIVTFTDNTKS